jgi:MFS family permease
MTMQRGAGPGSGVAQAAPGSHPVGRSASVQVRPARRPAGDTVAALPADPFAGRPWLRRPGSHRLSGRPAVFVLASLIVALLASSAAPTPLYAIYQAQWHFTPITTTVVFGVYALAVLAALLTLGRLSDYVGRRPVLLTAIAVHAGSAHQRAGLVSLLYVVSYLGLGMPAVLAGFGVVHGGGLIPTTRYYGAAVIALAALALFGLLKNRHGRVAEPAAAPAPAHTIDRSV